MKTDNTKKHHIKKADTLNTPKLKNPSKKKVVDEDVDSSSDAMGDEKDVDKVGEMTTSAATPGFQTPFAFGKIGKKSYEQGGWKTVKHKREPLKIDLSGGRLQEGMVKAPSFLESASALYNLEEGKYSDYKKDPSRPAHRKVNETIAEIEKALRVVEQLVSHSARLKQESGVSTDTYWKRSKEKLHKISERLSKIDHKLKDLSL